MYTVSMPRMTLSLSKFGTCRNTWNVNRRSADGL